MKCNKCDYENNNMSKFCVNCGTNLQEQVNLENNVDVTDQNTNSIEKNITNINLNNFESLKNNNSAMNDQIKDINTGSQTIISNLDSNTQPQVSDKQVYNGNNEEDKKTKISLIIGIVAIILSILLNIFVIPLSIFGLVLGLKSREKNKKRTIAIVLNIASVVIAIIVLIIGSLLLNSSGKTNTYYGSGYELEYDENWSITELSGGQEALQYKYQDSYLTPIGKSTLTQYTNDLNCDFNKNSCKESLYDKFYDYWSTNMPSDSLYLYKNNNLFMLLKDDIYYATYDYGTSKDNLKGKNYLIVSKEKDIILSFMSNSEAKNVRVLDKKIIQLFKKINIDDNSNINIIKDDELSGMLDSMNDWNRYSELRKGTLAKKDSINGGWRILSDSEQYWEFKDGKFWWYKSVNDLNDNYWYGTTKIATGLEGLKSVGLNEDNLKKALSAANGKIGENDIYTVICTPTKIISNGEDKSSTNIPADAKWSYVWIVINHGSEGIEGQVLNMNSEYVYETSYFIKIKD